MRHREQRKPKCADPIYEEVKSDPEAPGFTVQLEDSLSAESNRKLKILNAVLIVLAVPPALLSILCLIIREWGIAVFSGALAAYLAAKSVQYANEVKNRVIYQRERKSNELYLLEKKRKQEREYQEYVNGLCENAIVLDTETTGIDLCGRDEILQLSILKASTGEVLFSHLIRPESRQRWPKAQEVNGITPLMVKKEKKISFYHDEVQQILDSASMVVAYNAFFDLAFLRNAGFIYQRETADPMLDFGDYQRKQGSYGNYRRKLKDAAAHFGYTLRAEEAHDALNDTKATLFVFTKLRDEGYLKIRHQ